MLDRALARAEREASLHAIIKRRKLMRSPLATGPGLAWKYLYDVERLDGKVIVAGTDSLSNAEKMAYRDGCTYERAWEIKS